MFVATSVYDGNISNHDSLSHLNYVSDEPTKKSISLQSSNHLYMTCLLFRYTALL